MANQQREESTRPTTQTPKQGTDEQPSGPRSREAQRELSQERGGALSRPQQSDLASAFGTPPFGLNPFAFMRRMIEDMDRMFDDVFGRTWGGQQEKREEPPPVWAPQVELAQQGNDLVVRADLPGTREEDIRVEVRDDSLVIAGERRTEREEERGNVFRSERTYGSFRRVIPLPEGADTENANATFADGVLEIRVKMPEQQQSRRQLEIKSGGQRSEGAEKRVH